MHASTYCYQHIGVSIRKASGANKCTGKWSKLRKSLGMRLLARKEEPCTCDTGNNREDYLKMTNLAIMRGCHSILKVVSGRLQSLAIICGRHNNHQTLTTVDSIISSRSSNNSNDDDGRQYVQRISHHSWITMAPKFPSIHWSFMRESHEDESTTTATYLLAVHNSTSFTIPLLQGQFTAETVAVPRTGSKSSQQRRQLRRHFLRAYKVEYSLARKESLSLILPVTIFLSTLGIVSVLGVSMSLHLRQCYRTTMNGRHGIICQRIIIWSMMTAMVILLSLPSTSY